MTILLNLQIKQGTKLWKGSGGEYLFTLSLVTFSDAILFLNFI